MALEARINALVAEPGRIATLRQRLGSLSWFMRYLKEPIARRANREDACTGRFWEGRFRTQALLDDPAVLACMVYVDLNPVRAGMVRTPEAGRHTSLRRRLHSGDGHGDLLRPVAASIRSQILELPVHHYLDLVDWTARELHTELEDPGSRKAPVILERLAVGPRQWLVQVPATESRYWRAVGCVGSLLDRARLTGRRWIRGIGVARAMELVTERS